MTAEVYAVARVAALLVAVGVVVNSAELIRANQPLSSERLLSLRALLLTEKSRWLAAPSVVSTVIVIRALAAILLIAISLIAGEMAIPLVVMAATSIYLAWIKVIGGDGADQMTLVVSCSLSLAFLLGGTRANVEVALFFIAAQVLLAYLTAGVAKLFSPEWRDGVALTKIVDTVSYGLPRFASYLTRHRGVGRALSWGTIGFELATPLVLFLPPTAVVVLIVTAMSFHMACAVIMGLNDFVWSFASALPALWYTSQVLRAA